MSRTRHVHRNVKRWRNGKMMIRWMTAAVFEAAKGFRRLKGCKNLPALVAAKAASARWGFRGTMNPVSLSRVGRGVFAAQHERPVRVLDTRAEHRHRARLRIPLPRKAVGSKRHGRPR